MDRRKILLILSAMIAALGTLLVFLYVQGAEGRAKEDFESVEVIVATQDIAQGESFDDASGKFEKREVPKDALLSGAKTDLNSLDGLVALTPIYAGEQLIQDKWGGISDVDVTANVLAIPKAKVAAAVNLTDPARVAGFVNPGSQVAILVSVEEGRYTRTLLSRVTVLGVGATSTLTTTKTSGEGDSETTPIPQTLMTVAVSQKEAEKLLWGASFGELSFALVNKDSALATTGPVNEPNLFG
jgi:pilus assembly protein CpaB